MKQYILRVWRGWKSLFERSTGFLFPGGFSRQRTGTLLGTPCWGQKIILNSEYSVRVLFNRAKFFPEGSQCRSWFDIFPRFHYCDRILRSTLCRNGRLPHFSQHRHLPLMGCHKETTTIIARGQGKNIPNQLDQSFYHFSPSNVLLVSFRKKMAIFVIWFFFLQNHDRVL